MFCVNITGAWNKFFSCVEKVLSVFKNNYNSFRNGIAYPTLKTFFEQRQHSGFLKIQKKCLSNM